MKNKLVIGLGIVAALVLVSPFTSFAFLESTPGCTMSVSPQRVPINTVQDLTISIVNNGVTSTFVERQIEVVRYITDFSYTVGSTKCYTSLLAH